MTPTKVSTSISTTKPELPTGVSMALKMFGIKPEKIQEILNLALDSGMIEKLIVFPETVTRFEKKMDAIIKHFSIEVPE